MSQYYIFKGGAVGGGAEFWEKYTFKDKTKLHFS